MAEDGKIKIDKFDGHDFGFWKMQIEDYLYQKKLHEPYNVVNEKTTYGLFKALSNMYEKPSASNKVFLIRQLVNTKMNEGASVADHVNEFNSILSRLMSVDIKFDDEVQALLLLSSLPESWSGTVTAVSGSTGSTKLKFDNIRDLILGEDIRRKTSGESRSKSKKRGQSKNRQDITCWNCNQKGHFQNQCSKPVTSRDKEVNMAARDYDDALVCCVENTIDDRIMDSGASFHATYCKEELERFKLRSGKVRLADDKTLDIAGVGDVVLKTSFGTSWTLKDVRYIPGLKKRLISVGQLDEEGYHVGFRDQQWKVTKGSLVVARGNKRVSLYLVEVPSDGINATIDDRGNATLWHQRLGHMSEKGIKILASKGRIPDLQKAVVGFCEPCVLGKQKKVSFVKSGNTRKLQRLELVHTDVYGPTSVASIGGSRYYVTFIDDSSEEVWFICNGSDVDGLSLFGLQKIYKVSSDSRDVTFNEDSLYGAKATTDSKLLQGREVSARTPSYKALAEESRVRVRYSPHSKYLLLTKNGELESYTESLSSKESVQWKKAMNEEISSLEKNQTWSLVRLPAGKKALQSKWVFKVKEKQDGSKRHKARLVVKGFQQKQRVDYNETFSLIVKMTTIRLVLSIVAAKDLHQEQLDVKTAFLHGDLDEYIYMTQPEGFQSAGKEENLVCEGRLKRTVDLKEFEMKDLGSVKQILGMSIIRDKTKGTLRLSQEKYIGKVLEKFNMKDSEARCQPLGDHLKLSKKQSPKTEASRIAKVPYGFQQFGRREHYEAVKWLLCYLKGTSKTTLCFSRKEVVLEGFSDSDYGGCLDSGKSTTSYVFTLGEVVKELSAIHLMKNPVFHGQTKHIKIRYHYIRELVSEGTLSLKKILGAKNPVDMLTKVVQDPCIESLLALCLVGAACSVRSTERLGAGSSIVKGKVVQSLQRLLETESRSASKWEIVKLWRLILLGTNPIPHRSYISYRVKSKGITAEKVKKLKDAEINSCPKRMFRVVFGDVPISYPYCFMSCPILNAAFQNQKFAARVATPPGVHRIVV
ncbi:putative RNA-directed DNA polymerase [Tanacetum coccineum]